MTDDRHERRGPRRHDGARHDGRKSAPHDRGRSPQRGQRDDTHRPHRGQRDDTRKPQRGKRDDARKPQRGQRDDARKPRQSGNNASRKVERKAEETPSRVSPARLLVYEIIRQVTEEGAFASYLVASKIDTAPLARKDRAFATKLVYGVVSYRGTLDELINRTLKSPDDVNDDVRDALAISAYEIIYLAKAHHAAVDQGVELVRSFAPKATRLANHVLHRIVEAKEKFPFGDPRKDIEAYARLHGFPLWLVKRLIDILGSSGAHAFITASNEPAPQFVASNILKARDEEAYGLLKVSRGEPSLVEIEGKVIPGCFRIENSRCLADPPVSQAIDTGKLLVTDATGQAVARLLLPAELPKSALEIGAGRGGKTILLQNDAMRVFDKQIPRYVAMDNVASKCELLKKRLHRYGVEVSDVICADGTEAHEVLGDEKFDFIFIDAPCSGLGTLRRHPEIRWRLAPETIEERAAFGLRLLAEASHLLAPRGELIYATCTITPEENTDVVKSFLASEAGAEFSLAPIAGKASFSPALVPGSPDAYFAVKLVRSL